MFWFVLLTELNYTYILSSPKIASQDQDSRTTQMLLYCCLRNLKDKPKTSSGEFIWSVILLKIIFFSFHYHSFSPLCFVYMPYWVLSFICSQNGYGLGLFLCDICLT